MKEAGPDTNVYWPLYGDMSFCHHSAVVVRAGRLHVSRQSSFLYSYRPPPVQIKGNLALQSISERAKNEALHDKFVVDNSHVPIRNG